MKDGSRHETGTSGISITSSFGSCIGCKAATLAPKAISGSLMACASSTLAPEFAVTGSWYVGNGTTISRKGGRVSHIEDHSGSSEMLLGREKRGGGGGGGSGLEDDKGDRDGSAEKSLGREAFREINATLDDGNGSASLPGHGLTKAI